MNPKEDMNTDYKAPAIIFEATITTRAGSIVEPGGREDGFDVLGND